MRIPKYIGWPLIAVWAYVVLYWLANRAVYYPLKYPQGWWQAQKELGAEDVWLHTRDGVKLHAWWIPVKDAGLATLYLHGNAGNLTFRVAHIREITAAGSSLLLIDYRGYGRSEGRPSEKGLYEDAEASYQHLLKAGWRPEQIVAHGESLGTAVAVDLAARHRVGGVVLEAPFTSARQVAAGILPLLGPLVIRGFDSRAKIGRLQAPLLIVHGDRDEIIPYDLGRALFAAAPEPKQFWTVHGSGHNDIVDTAGPAYRERLAGFYKLVRQRLP